MQKRKLFIISGLAGSGKSTAMKAFEDAGFYCVDNMPVTLLPNFLELATIDKHNMQNFAFVMDLRTKEFLKEYKRVFEKLQKSSYHCKILFFKAKENILIKRYSETRRLHPLHKANLKDALKEEKNSLQKLQKMSDKIIDTSNLNVHQLKSIVSEIIKEKTNTEKLRINLVSFGFKHGTPYDADLIVDVRFLKNPFFVSKLKNLTGEDKKVVSFVLENKTSQVFLEKYQNLISFLIPEYEKEGKAYLTIAIGCTGGVHRSVVIAKQIYKFIKSKRKNIIELNHRDITQR